LATLFAGFLAIGSASFAFGADLGAGLAAAFVFFAISVPDFLGIRPMLARPSFVTFFGSGDDDLRLLVPSSIISPSSMEEVGESALRLGGMFAEKILQEVGRSGRRTGVNCRTTILTSSESLFPFSVLVNPQAEAQAKALSILM
jgi:hypothetical protein